MSSTRNGLTLIEVIIAMLVFTVGALGLAASSAAVARQLASSQQRSHSAQMAAARQEKLNAAPCASSSGLEISWGITNNWASSKSASRVSLSQTLLRQDSKGRHIELFLAGAPCD